MEEEARLFADIAEFLGSVRVQLDHWFQEEGNFTHSFVGEERKTLAPSEFWEVQDWSQWEAKPRDEVEEKVRRAYFVDGRMRIHARILAGTTVILLGEIVAGYSEWDAEKGISMGFSPQERPLLRRVLGVPHELLQGQIIEKRDLDLGEGFIFQLEESTRVPRDAQAGETSRQAFFNALSRLERDVVIDLLNRGFPVIKDGILPTSDRLLSFRPGVGPVGMVKRIEQVPLLPVGAESLFLLNRGERTPFVSVLSGEDPSLLKVFSYLKLVAREEHHPWKGIVRLEVVVRKDDFASVKDDISVFFNEIAWFLPTLTGDFPWRRLPENLFPIIALEDYLGQFFAASPWVQYLWQKKFWGENQ